MMEESRDVICDAIPLLTWNYCRKLW